MSKHRAKLATGRRSSHGTVTGHLRDTLREPPQAFVKSTIAEIGAHTDDRGFSERLQQHHVRSLSNQTL